MSTNKSQGTRSQAKRRTRSLEDREKRDAAFAKKRRGRPKGSRLRFWDDPDRFAVAMVACGEHLLKIPRYHAAYIALALMSDGPIDAGSKENTALLTGGPDHATLQGASYALVAKCDMPKTVDEADWIASSAAFLCALVRSHGAADQSRLRIVFDGLAKRGWGPTLLKIAEKLAAVGASNLPPIDEPVPSHVLAWLDHTALKSKS